MIDLTKLIRTTSEGTKRANRALNIAFATTEFAPLAKTGGLGDVAAALPKALADRGHRVAVIMPLYQHLDPEAMRLSKRLRTLSVPTKGKSGKIVEATVWETAAGNGVKLFFIDYPPFFHREGIYGYDDSSFEDNPERFAFFSRAVVEFARQFGIPFDVIHLNDWHTALAPTYIDQFYKKELQVATVLTVHNVAYQGAFDASKFDATGLTKTAQATLTHGDGINFLKAGIVSADAITTVSPTYADEIRTSEAGCGLEDLFEKRGEDLTGILNGADYTIWSPDVDHNIEVRFDEATLNGKRVNKAKLQHDFKLPVRPILPMIAFVGRMTEQKGLDILVPAVRKLLKAVTDEQEGFQFVFLGEGESVYERQVLKLVDEFPRRVACHIGYSEELAHQIIASADMLVVPSRFEPCGLTQIYAMRYGTLPIVHSTGGLADTVIDADDEEQTGTGFVFDNYDRADLWETLGRASLLYRKHRRWRPIMVNAMQQQFSWDESARDYENTYYRALGERGLLDKK